MYWKKKNYKTTSVKQNNKVTWIEFDLLNDRSYPVRHAFSTRLGGVSRGNTGSMNLRRCVYDSDENYCTNIHRFFDAAGLSFDNLVATHQTHTVNVHTVTQEDVPTGTLFDRQFEDIDALVTNLKHVPLVCSFADCIPIFLYAADVDAIGMAHAGWRGCVGDIAGETVRRLVSEYGAKPENISACIGPGICSDCYEVGCEVAERFRERLGEERASLILKPGREGHFQLDLLAANREFLLLAGLHEDNIAISDICTACNPDKLFSHRVLGPVRGGQIGVIELI